jgi:hypothetical protein
VSVTEVLALVILTLAWLFTEPADFLAPDLRDE